MGLTLNLKRGDKVKLRSIVKVLAAFIGVKKDVAGETFEVASIEGDLVTVEFRTVKQQFHKVMLEKVN